VPLVRQRVGKDKTDHSLILNDQDAQCIRIRPHMASSASALDAERLRGMGRQYGQAT
jgi:hypothetical protein